MNNQLVNSLTQIILSLSDDEKNLLNQQTNLDKKNQHDLTNIYKQIEDLEKKLKFYEANYKMSSDEFYPKFRTGKLGDDIDFFEWGVLYEMLLSAQEELKLLK